jgi:hypothetical protein
MLEKEMFLEHNHKHFIYSFNIGYAPVFSLNFITLAGTPPTIA